MGLTDEQKRKIDENRNKALLLRATKQQQSSTMPHTYPTKRPMLNASKVKPAFGSSTSTPSTSTSHLQAPRTSSTTTGQTMPLKTVPITTNPPHSVGQMSSKVSKPSSSWQEQSKSIFNSAFKKPLPNKQFQGFSPEKKNVSVKGKCSLISSTSFVVDVGFCAPLIEIFKSMETKSYDTESKLWSFDLKEYRSLYSKMVSMKGCADIAPLPQPVLTAFHAALKGSSQQRVVPSADIAAADPYLASLLMPFQKEGVDFAIWRRGRVLLADDMGLGKTIQALAIARYYHEEWPLLVITPSSVRFTWKQEIMNRLPSVKEENINVVTKGSDSCSFGLIVIMSYELMTKKQKQLMDQAFQIIIMDESHFLKNSKTARAQAAMPLLKKARRVLLLSGTPALSRPSELFTQISAIDGRIFPHFKEYGVRYCNGREMQWGWDFTGSSNLPELQLLLEHSIMIRRMKRDVMSQLPSKCRTMVLLDPSSVKITKTMQTSHTLVDKMKGSERRGALLEYFHETSAAKIPAVKTYILELLEADRKFLMFAHHQEVLDAVEQTFIAKSVGYMRIDGRTPPEQRQINVDRFQDSDHVKVALLSITAANAGLNLTAASLVVFAELFWNPGILMQAEDRAHRIGQQDSVSVQYLVAKGTADDSIWPLVQQKLQVLGKAGLSKDNFTEASTKCLQGPQQTRLLQYFKESFIEAAALDNGNEGSHTVDIPKKQSMKIEPMKSSSPLPDLNCDWPDQTDEFWEDMDPDAPWPKKPRL